MAPGARTASRATALGLLVSLALLAGAPAAFADHSFDRFLALGTGGAGGQHSSPRGIAVNESGSGGAEAGDIYVAEQGNRRVQVFAADGTFKFAFGRDVIAPGAPGDQGDVFEKCTVAVDCKQGATGERGGEFGNAAGIAINQSTGDVYVRDRATSATAGGNPRVQQFDATGDFIRAWGWGVATGAEEFEICEVASQCQRGLTGGGVGQFAQSGGSALTGIAVSPLDGDVFVVDPGASAQPNRRLQRFDSDGSNPSVIGGASEFAANLPTHLAVDADGIVYAHNSASSNAVVRYDSVAEAFLAPLAVSGLSGTASTATTALAVDPSTDNLLVARSAAVGVLEFSEPGGGSAAHTGTHVAGFGITPQGLAVNPATGNLYVSANAGTAGHGVYSFDAAGTGAGTEIAALDVSGSNATPTTIDLVGTVDPDDGLVRARFEYSPDGTSWIALPVVAASGSGPQEISTQLTGLDPNSFYRVRLIVEKVLGPNDIISVTSEEVVVLTAAAPPAVTTFSPANRTDTSAQLRAFIDPNGSATTYRFEWGGAGGSFDNHVPIPDASAGSGNSELMVTETIAGLLPETAYRYRIVATNPTGTTIGDPVTFTTQATPTPQPPLADRAYELVSPADKVGGVGVGSWIDNPRGVASSGFPGYEGERFAAQGQEGSILMDGEFAFASDWALAERTNDTAGWQSHSPLTHPSRIRQFATFFNPHAAAPDLSSLAWRTNNFTPVFFDDMQVEGWSFMNASYLSDWGPGNRWEMLGPTSLDPFDQITSFGGGGGASNLWNVALSADGSTAIGSTRLNAISLSAVVGLAGAGDPSHPDHGGDSGDLLAGRLIYLADLSAGFADNFADTGPRELVNVCAEGTELPAVDGAGDLVAEECPDPLPGRDTRLVSERGATFEVANTSVGDRSERGANAVSADGSRIFFMSPDPSAAGVPDGTTQFCESSGDICPAQLYVRQRNADGSVVTRWLSRAEDGLFGDQAASLTGTVRFEGASADGSRVFFRTNSPLTADDPNGEGAATPGGVTTGEASNDSWDLYVYELGSGDDPTEGGELTRISSGPDGEGDCNGRQESNPRQAMLRFASDDGERLYFVCSAPLDGAAGPQNGTITAPGGTPSTANQTNLYLYDANLPEAERWRFVARLPRSTSSSGASAADSCATTGTELSSGLSPGSAASGGPGLAGRANCVRGTSDGEFVTFWTRGRLLAADPDSQSADVYGYDAATDELFRLTAPQGGVGGSHPCGVEGGAENVPCYGDGGVEESSSGLAFLGLATDPLVPGDRIAFFQSKSRLVPEDQNDDYDVYEWRNGELSLVTTGAPDAEPAYYRGNDASGRNVFFATKDSLSWQDFDDVRDIYTARVGGGIPEPAPPPACDIVAGACQPPAPPAPPAPQPGIAAPEAEQPEARDCNQLQRQARQATQRAKSLRQRARNLRQRAKRQASRGNRQRAKRLRQRANNRVQPRARNQRQRAQRLRVEAQECREAQRPRRAR